MSPRRGPGKGKPVAIQGRKAAGALVTAGLPERQTVGMKHLAAWCAPVGKKEALATLGRAGFYAIGQHEVRAAPLTIRAEDKVTLSSEHGTLSSEWD